MASSHPGVIDCAEYSDTREEYIVKKYIEKRWVASFNIPDVPRSKIYRRQEAVVAEKLLGSNDVGQPMFKRPHLGNTSPDGSRPFRQDKKNVCSYATFVDNPVCGKEPGCFMDDDLKYAKTHRSSTKVHVQGARGTRTVLMEPLTFDGTITDPRTRSANGWNDVYVREYCLRNEIRSSEFGSEQNSGEDEYGSNKSFVSSSIPISCRVSRTSNEHWSPFITVCDIGTQTCDDISLLI